MQCLQLKAPTRAATQLLRSAGAEVTHALFMIELADLGGAQLLRGEGLVVEAVMEFPGH